MVLDLVLVKGTIRLFFQTPLELFKTFYRLENMKFWLFYFLRQKKSKETPKKHLNFINTK